MLHLQVPYGFDLQVFALYRNGNFNGVVKKPRTKAQEFISAKASNLQALTKIISP